MSLYAETRAAELALVPWNDEQKQAFIVHQFNAQHDHYRTHFPEASFDVILVEGRPAGRLYVLRDPEQMRILDLSLDPEFRSKGVGGDIIRGLMNEARESKRPLRINLEMNNPQVPVFTHWGFLRTTSDDGFRWLYEWLP